MIPITDEISLDEAELSESFIRASGPGGQNVNKVSSAVQLRFDARHSRSLPDRVRVRLEQLAGNLVTQDGVIVITARRSRSQEENRADAVARLVELIREAARPVVPRRATKPTFASKRRRLETQTTSSHHQIAARRSSIPRGLIGPARFRLNELSDRFDVRRETVGGVDAQQRNVEIERFVRPSSMLSSSSASVSASAS